MICVNIILQIISYFNLCLALFQITNDSVINNYTVASTRIFSDPLNKVKRNAYIYNSFFNLTIFNESYKVYIRFNSIDLYGEETQLIFYNDINQTYLKSDQFSLNIVTGFVLTKPQVSKVSGYVKAEKFYGTVHLQNVTYYVEELRKFPWIAKKYENDRENNALIYDKQQLPEDRNTIWLAAYRANKVENNRLRNEYKQFIRKKSICSLFVLMDNSFLRIIHEGDIKTALSQIMLSLDKAHCIFRNADFDEDGISDNIGFFVKYIAVIQTENSIMNLLPYYSRKPMDSRFFLTHFTQYAALRDVCLGVVFTAQSFKNNVLGVSYAGILEPNSKKMALGGICQRPVPDTNWFLTLNTLAVSYTVENNVHLFQTTLDICLAHEFGHSFGSRHDKKGFCEGYLMSPHSLEGKIKKNFLFSPCSNTQIIATVVKKGECLEEALYPFCGNGIVEDGEECDCGLWIDCLIKDKCCLPRGSHRDSCKVNRRNGHECHPSQGYCCSDSCRYRDMGFIGIDCTRLGDICPCSETMEGATCQCGLGGECFQNQCHHIECTRVKARECSCPAKISVCSVCCYSNNNECKPAVEITRYNINHNVININQLKEHENRINFSIQGRLVKFCKKTDCVNLFFEQSNKGDYCLTKGKLGKCKASGCRMKHYNNHLPPETILERSSARKNYNERSYLYFYLLSLVYCMIFFNK